MYTTPVFALTRHGDYRQPQGVPSALLPYPLTEEGIVQARAAGLVCEGFAKDNKLTVLPVLDCSRQLRAWQTATLLAESMTGEYTVDEYPELSERSVGAVANLTVQQIEAVLSDDPRYGAPPDDWKSDSHYCLPFQGAESLIQAGERVAAHIQQQIQTITQPCLKIIVGHGAAIRHACVQLGILDLSTVRTVSMHHAAPVFITYSDGQWRKVGGQWKLRSGLDQGDEIRA
tara:strand:- start:61641 stop:62330 length:690 start_codon:yes stop_codon:yes gene_type:complete